MLPITIVGVFTGWVFVRSKSEGRAEGRLIAKRLLCERVAAAPGLLKPSVNCLQRAMYLAGLCGKGSVRKRRAQERSVQTEIKIHFIPGRLHVVALDKVGARLPQGGQHAGLLHVGNDDLGVDFF